MYVSQLQTSNYFAVQKMLVVYFVALMIQI